MSTHGLDNSAWAEWSMWDYGSYALTPYMRLDASGRQNMVFATYACDTHRLDSNTWNRWIHVFSGGLASRHGGRKRHPLERE